MSLDHPGYNVMKTVVDGQLVAMSLPKDAETPIPFISPTTKEPPQIEVVEGAGEEDAGVEA